MNTFVVIKPYSILRFKNKEFKKKIYLLFTHPYSAPNKIPPPTPSTTQTITVKYSFLGD